MKYIPLAGRRQNIVSVAPPSGYRHQFDNAQNLANLKENVNKSKEFLPPGTPKGMKKYSFP